MTSTKMLQICLGLARRLFWQNVHILPNCPHVGNKKYFIMECMIHTFTFDIHSLFWAWSGQFSGCCQYVSLIHGRFFSYPWEIFSLIHWGFFSDPLGDFFSYPLGILFWSMGDFFLIHGRFLVCNSRPNCLRFIRRRDDTWTGLQTTTNLTELKFLLLLLLVHLICGKFALIFDLGLIFILQTICGGCLSSWIKQVHLCKRMWWLYECSIW